MYTICTVDYIMTRNVNIEEKVFAKCLTIKILINMLCWSLNALIGNIAEFEH